MNTVATPPKAWIDLLSQKALVKLQEAGRRLLLGGTKCVFWDEVLTPGQRNQLGDPQTVFNRYGGIIGVWRKFYGGSQPRAIIESAFRTRHLDQQGREWLLREIGEPLDEPKPRTEMPRPSWQQEIGKLRLGDKIIRKVRVMSDRSNVQKILDSFEKAQWPMSIPNPLTRGQQQLHEALRSLNGPLKSLRFHAHNGAETIYWEVV